VCIRFGSHQALDRLHLPLHLPALGSAWSVDLDERLSSPDTRPHRERAGSDACDTEVMIAPVSRRSRWPAIN
jgi:hypothetical protein